MTRFDEVLAEVPEEHRAEVTQLARRHMNCAGGRPSDAARIMVKVYFDQGIDHIRQEIAKKWW